MTDDVAGLIERLQDIAKQSHVFGGWSDIAGEAAAAFHTLVQENERLKVGIAFGNDLLPALQQRIRELAAERDALKEELGTWRDYAGDGPAAIRAKTIEECAQVIQEDFDRPDMAEAIRALAHASTSAQQDESKTESGK